MSDNNNGACHLLSVSERIHKMYFIATHSEPYKSRNINLADDKKKSCWR